MGLREELEKSGNWLFQRRSYLPLIFLPLIFWSLYQILGRPLEDEALRQRETWKGLCILVSFSGLAFRCWTVGWVSAQTSGRNTQKQVADRLNIKGLYSLVRHPLYGGNFLLFLGIILWTQHIWLIMLAVLTFWAYYTPIMFAEEEFLRKKFGPSFLNWSKQTPAVIPRLKGWKSQGGSWSVKTVLRREHASMFALVSTLVCLELVENRLSHGSWALSLSWSLFLSLGLVVYLVLRFLKKKTKILDVPGR